MFATVINHTQVKGVPAVGGKKALQITLRPRDVFSPRQPPPLREAVNVGVDGKRRHVKRLRHDDLRGFVPHAG